MDLQVNVSRRQTRVRQVRKTKGLTQAQLAEKISALAGADVSGANIGDLELGRVKNVFLLALSEQALGIADVPVSEPVDFPADEKRLLSAYRTSNADRQRRLLDTAEDFAQLTEQSAALTSGRALHPRD